MNHGYFVSLLWKGIRALALIPREWNCVLLCAFGHQRAGNGRDGTHHPQVELREKANPSLCRQSTFLMLHGVELHQLPSAAWSGILGSAEAPASSQPFSPHPSGKLCYNPAWRGSGHGKGRGTWNVQPGGNAELLTGCH